MTKVEKLNKLVSILIAALENITYPCNVRIFINKILPLKESDPVLYLKLLYAISEDIYFIKEFDKDPSIIDKVEVCLWK